MSQDHFWQCHQHGGFCIRQATMEKANCMYFVIGVKKEVFSPWPCYADLGFTTKMKQTANSFNARNITSTLSSYQNHSPAMTIIASNMLKMGGRVG